MKKYFLFALPFFFSCVHPGPSREEKARRDSVFAAIQAQLDSLNHPAPKVGWTYSQNEDKMTSGVSYFAEAQAKELLQFEFPYDGGSTATLMIRNKEGDNDVMLNVSKGQFITHYDGSTIRARFDNDSPVRYNISEPSDGSSDLVFINAEKDFISKLKKAKKLILEAEFYNAGLRQMEFDVSDFKWDH